MAAASSKQRRDARLLEQLLEWGRARPQTLPPEQRSEILEGLLQAALDLCGADSGSLMVVDDAGRELRVVVSRGLTLTADETPRIKVGDRIAGHIARTGTPMLLRSEGPDPCLESFLNRRQEIRTAACVPCRAAGQVLGVMTVNQRWNGKAEMDESDLARLQVLADHAAPEVGRMTALSPQTGTVETRWIADPMAQARIDRLANLGVVAGGIAHEINNPLQGAMGLVEVILQQHQTQTTGDRERDLTALREDLYRLADIVSSLLSFVREKDAGPPFTRNVVDCMEFAIRSALTQNATAQIECQRSYETELPPVLITPAHLRQVLLNLVINAIQAMGKQGVLRIGARKSAEGRFLRLTVADTGPGIAASATEQIFEAGFTTKTDGQGTGLGLAVSRSIVRENGGDLTVSSDPGEGATFTVRLPVA